MSTPTAPTMQALVLAAPHGALTPTWLPRPQAAAGQVLVRIDRDRATLQVAQSEAQVRKLEANYRRATQLAGQQMVSANDVDQLRYDLENARAAYRLAR